MNPTLLLLIPIVPLIAAVLAGVFGRVIGRVGAHTVTIAGVAISCALSIYVLKQIYWDGVPTYNAPVYTWLISDSMHMDVSFLIDRLTMLMLVMANNFKQLFFGWEGVGVVSYLLIGFWYTRPTAIFASLKAFVVNRIGDFGFILGIAGIAYYTNSMSYTDAFAAAPKMAHAMLPMTSTTSVEALTLICICLFVGAMGKSAQVPLHVWLPDSMEGPTPISALIHAAT